MMLCKSITEQELIKGKWQDYISELKLDGSRMILLKQDNKISLISRDNNDYTSRYPEIVNEAKDLPDCIIDGELTFYNSEGKDVFLTSLATAETIKEYGVKPRLMVFDILELNGIDYKNNPLLKRKEALSYIFGNMENKNIRLLEWHNDAVKLWELVKREDREGIVLKRADSIYTPNFRSKMWLKCKNFSECELYFTSFEPAKNDRGITLTNEQGYRVFVQGKESLKVLQILERDKKVKCMIQYLQKTKDNKLRFLSFRGIA